MSTESESAEQVVRLSLEGFEVVARLTGSLAKNFAVMLYSLSKDTNKKTKGKTRLTNMMKSNSNLTIFSIKEEDYVEFKKEAKRYGILYSALYNKNEKTNDGLVDLVVREEDAVRVNRVIERYNITKVDIEKVEKQLDEKEQTENKNTEKPVIDKDIQAKNTSEDLMNRLLKKQNIKEENENTNPSNLSNSEKDIRLGNSLKMSEGNEKMKHNEEKPSIIEKVERIKEQNAQKEKEKEKEKEVEIPTNTEKQTKSNETKYEHQPPKTNKKNRKEKQK